MFSVSIILNILSICSLSNFISSGSLASASNRVFVAWSTSSFSLIGTSFPIVLTASILVSPFTWVIVVIPFGSTKFTSYVLSALFIWWAILTFPTSLTPIIFVLSSVVLYNVVSQVAFKILVSPVDGLLPTSLIS